MAEKLTGKLVRDLPGPEGHRAYAVHWDGQVPGFGVRITAKGTKALILDYRAKGTKRRMTLETIPDGATNDEAEKLIAKARRRASQVKSGAKYEGIDPMVERHADRAASTVRQMSERYTEEHLPKKRPSSQVDAGYMLDGHILPAIGSKRVAEVTFSDIDNLHRKVTKAGSPIRANRVVAMLSVMFGLAIKWGMRVDNPCKGVQRNPEERRQRYLTPDELGRVAVALSTHAEQPSANAIRLLLLTGARRGEVLGATWDQFELGEGAWVKPSSHTKQKKEHRVPLSAPARQLIAGMLEAATAAAEKDKAELSPFLFPGKEGQPQKALKRFWATICTDAKISGVRVHDLRHTYASVLASSGLSLPVIGALLGHTNPGTTQRYAHLFDEPLRAATEKAAGVILGTNRKKTKAKIVPLPSRRRK